MWLVSSSTDEWKFTSHVDCIFVNRLLVCFALELENAFDEAFKAVGYSWYPHIILI